MFPLLLLLLLQLSLQLSLYYCIRYDLSKYDKGLLFNTNNGEHKNGLQIRNIHNYMG